MSRTGRLWLLDLGMHLMALVAVLAVISSLGGALLPSLRDLHRAWWFRALLAWGCIALAACGISSLVELVSRFRGAGIPGSRPPGAQLAAGLRGLTVERLAGAFRSNGYRVGRWDVGPQRVVEGLKGWPGWLGRGLLHCGLATALLGGGVDTFLGWSDRLVIGEGDRISVGRPSSPVVVVADSIHWGPPGAWASVRAQVPMEPGPAEPRAMRPGDVHSVSGREVRLVSIGPSDRHFLSARIGVRITEGAATLVDLPADVPVAVSNGDTLTAIAYLPPSSFARSATGPHTGGRPVGPALHLRVARGDTVNAFWVTPTGAAGEGLRSRRFSLHGVTPAPEAVVEVRRAPGDPFVAAGLLAFSVGVVCSVGVPARRIWGIVGSEGEATLGAHGPLAGRGWYGEVDRLVGALLREARGEDGE